MEHNRITGPHPELAYFNNREHAMQWRSGYGGWIFAADNGETIWFSPRMTPSAIMTHRATRGLNGSLI